MKLWVFACSSLIVGCLAPPSEAAPVVINANDLATSASYCEAPLETFTIAPGATLTVEGETGAVDGSCTIELSEGSKLIFRDAILTGTALFTVTGGNGSRYEMKNSQIDFSGDIDIQPGCCDDAFVKDKVKISSQSRLKSTNGVVTVHATPSGTGGKVSINKSVLDGGNGAGDFVYVRASDQTGATDGSVKVAKSTLDGLGASVLVSTLGGKTVVSNTIFSFDGATPPTITAQGGKCKTNGNTPPTVVCS